VAARGFRGSERHSLPNGYFFCPEQRGSRRDMAGRTKSNLYTTARGSKKCRHCTKVRYGGSTEGVGKGGLWKGSIQGIRGRHTSHVIREGGGPCVRVCMI